MAKLDRRAAVLLVTVLIVLFVAAGLYVLSIGPARWLGSHGYLSADSYYHIYYPIIWLGHDERGKMIPVLQWYLDMWGP